jgi:hypothetical protein
MRRLSSGATSGLLFVLAAGTLGGVLVMSSWRKTRQPRAPGSGKL